MSWLTMTVAGVLLFAGAMGWRAGLIRRVLELVGVTVAIMVAAEWGAPVGGWLDASTGLPPRIATPAGWILVVVLGIVVTRLVAWGVAKLIRLTVLGWLDKVGGALFGMLAGVLVSSVLLIIAANLPPNEDLRAMIRDEPLPRLIHGAAPALWTVVAGEDRDPADYWRDARDAASDAARDLGRDAADAAVKARDAALNSAVESAVEKAGDLGQDAIDAAEKIGEVADDLTDGKGS